MKQTITYALDLRFYDTYMHMYQVSEAYINWYVNTSDSIAD